MLQLLPSPTEKTNNQLVRNNRLSVDGTLEGNVSWLERQLLQPAMMGATTEDMTDDTPAQRPPDGTSAQSADDAAAQRPPDDTNAQPPADDRTTSTDSDDEPALVSDPTYVVRLGGTDLISFRLRTAQAHLRHHMWPSHWSHAVLLGPRKTSVERQRLYEISLQPRHGFDLAVMRTGLQETTVSRYDDPDDYPNIAVLRINVRRDSWAAQRDSDGPPNVLQSFQTQRAIFDSPEAILMWLAFVWGVGRTGNPLFDGTGIPSACMIEAVLNGVGFDISPGVDGRVSAPEVFWQTAKWWYPFHETNDLRRIVGRYDIGSRINDDLLSLPNRRHRAPGRISGR
jgi:hypothetical protein